MQVRERILSCWFLVEQVVALVAAQAGEPAVVLAVVPVVARAEVPVVARAEAQAAVRVVVLEAVPVAAMRGTALRRS